MTSGIPYRDKGPDFWLAILKKIFIDTPKYVVKGVPSVAKQRADTRWVPVFLLLKCSVQFSSSELISVYLL
jgi:hypothetical protein